MTTLVDVPLLHQYDNNLPTGCESCAAFMLLKWAGVTSSLTEVIDAVDKVPLPSKGSDGVLRGGNPYKGFVGDPYDKDSFGVFAPPIFKLVDHFTKRAQNLTGKNFDDILQILKSENKPIVCWCTLDMREPSVTDTWIDEEGNEVQWKSPEHALLLVGFNQNEVIVNDPHTGRRDHHPLPLFKQRFEQMGSQAVSVQK